MWYRSRGQVIRGPGAGVSFSMDGRGRFRDNIFIERLWRSLKYKAVYLHELRDGPGRRAMPTATARGQCERCTLTSAGARPREPAGPRRSAGSLVPVRLAPPAAKPGSPVGGFPSRRPGLSWHLWLPLQSEDLRVEDLPRENAQRVLPRAIPTSRNPPYLWRRTVQRSRTTRLGPMAWREIH